MDSLSEAYSKVKRFIDGFANSSSDDCAHFRPEVTEAQNKQNSKPFYADYDDNSLDAVVDNAMTKRVLRGIVDKRFGGQMKSIIQRSSELHKDSFPQLFSVYSHCCDTLGICNRPETYITGCLAGINALSMEVCGISYILISRDAVFLLDNKEQSFLIGHELGHYQQGNLVCHTLNGIFSSIVNSREVLGSVLADSIEVPLKRWCRQCEFNADRAGFICCGDMGTIESLFAKITEKRYRTSYSSISELFEDHPLLMTRMEKLIEFSGQLS